ncbi:MAG TPA: hypothetical protein VI542_08260 [Candidatus Tectomicrobia bacterium]
MTKVKLHAIGTSTTLESNKSLDSFLPAPAQACVTRVQRGPSAARWDANGASLLPTHVYRSLRVPQEDRSAPPASSPCRHAHSDGRR